MFWSIRCFFMPCNTNCVFDRDSPHRCQWLTFLFQYSNDRLAFSTATPLDWLELVWKRSSTCVVVQVLFHHLNSGDGIIPACFYKGVGKCQVVWKGKEVIGMLSDLKDFLQTLTKYFEDDKKKYLRMRRISIRI